MDESNSKETGGSVTLPSTDSEPGKAIQVIIN